MVSRATGVVFQAEGPHLRLTDAVTGVPLLRKEEERKARRQAEDKAAAEARARQHAEEKARALEEELARLR